MEIVVEVEQKKLLATPGGEKRNFLSFAVLK